MITVITEILNQRFFALIFRLKMLHKTTGVSYFQNGKRNGNGRGNKSGERRVGWKQQGGDS